MNAVVAPCSHRAARHAVQHWHYSRTMPVGKLVKYGVWEGGRFQGVVLFGRGATPRLGWRYELAQTEVCELVRVALRAHTTPVSQIVARALKLLHRGNPGLRLVVSFADTAQGHHGGIYQAGNWIYTGVALDRPYLRVHGVVHHPRSLGARYGVGGQSLPWLRAHVDPNTTEVPPPPKYRYLYPLDRAMRRRVAPLGKPYPSRPAGEGSTVSRPGSTGEGPVRARPPALITP